MDIHFITRSEIEAEVDCLVIPAWEGAVEEACKSPLLAQEDRINLKILAEKKLVTGGENFYLPTPMSAYQGILILGLGKKEKCKCSADKLRQSTGKALSILKSQKKHHILLELAHVPEMHAENFVEAIVLGQYDYSAYKTGKKPEEAPVKVTVLCVHVDESKDLTLEQAKSNRAQTMCEAANLARDIGNTPGNDMTPTILAARAKAVADANGCEYTLLDEARMKQLGMGLLLGVSQGSAEPATLSILRYTHPKATKTVALVGKGLTFDAGGISLKPGKGMEEMKFDKCGGAAVIGAFQAIAAMKPAINLIVAVPASENLPSGTATKPGDIHRAYNGKTVEIYNTDAEGRLILSDALAYVVDQYKPDCIIDIATLTGAVITALGHNFAAIMANDEALASALTSAGATVHERLWRLPQHEEYGELIKGKDADYCNIGPGFAGTITAGQFLQNFVGDTKWAHLDIAGTAWNHKGASYIDGKLASGFGARLLAQFVLDQAE